MPDEPPRRDVLDALESRPRVAAPTFAKRPVAGVRAGKRKPVSLAGAGVEIHFGEADNPYFSRDHAETGSNPKRIRVARNLNESPLVRLAALGTIDDRQARAGYYVRALYEKISTGGQSSSFLRERVDRTRHEDGFTDSKAAAARRIGHLADAVGPNAFHILLRVCGEGMSLNAYARMVRRRRADLPADLCRALDAVAAFMGLGRPRADNDAG